MMSENVELTPLVNGEDNEGEQQPTANGYKPYLIGYTMSITAVVGLVTSLASLQMIKVPFNIIIIILTTQEAFWDSRWSGSGLSVPENSYFGSDQGPTRVPV